MTQPLRARRWSLCPAPGPVAVIIAFTLIAAGGHAFAKDIAPERLTPVVLAVREARPAVVSIQGQKMVAAPEDATAGADGPRQVNGMGTGTVIDERGYILTNYHVVSDVRRIQVTLDDGRGYTAELVASDKQSDLAVIKIPAPKPLPVIRIGTSSDLMEGESVIALGNAFGYEQTVTRGIISALGRDVQVSDTQSYEDLIQTDASINPGNSGGPLLNNDGEMVGVNVAVRAGAQGIGFAIPIDSAIRVAASLLNVERLQSRWHGIVAQGDDVGAPLHVSKVEASSPAEKIGLQPGDEVVRVGKLAICRPLDLERAFLDRPVGEPVAVEVRRNGQTLELELALAEHTAIPIVATTTDRDPDEEAAQVWDVLGMKLSEEPRTTFQRRSTRYRGGMHVDEVRPDSSAAKQGILPGDILVGMHRWETTSDQDVQYIISRPNLSQMGQLKFYVLRDKRTLFGELNVASKSASSPQSTTRK